MQYFANDLLLIAALWAAAAILMVLLLSLAVRVAAVPLLDAVGRYRRVAREVAGEDARLARLEKSIRALGREIEMIRAGGEDGRASAA